MLYADTIPLLLNLSNTIIPLNSANSTHPIYSILGFTAYNVSWWDGRDYSFTAVGGLDSYPTMF